MGNLLINSLIKIYHYYASVHFRGETVSLTYSPLNSVLDFN